MGVVLRPVGNLERFSTVRHSLGFYRSVAFTGKYCINTIPYELPSAIEVAVAKVVLQNPHLCCGIIDEDKKHPSYVRIDSIDLSHHIEFRSLDASTAEDYDQALLKVIKHQHSQLWADLDRRPGWKIIVVQPKKRYQFRELVLDIIFAYHHAPVDGLSGMAFHRLLLEALNDPETTSQLDGHTLKVPETSTLLPPVEQIIDFKVSWLYFSAQVWKGLRPKWLFPDPNPPWSAEICSYKPIETYASRLKLILISGDQVSKVLALCREQKATITGLLHGLIVASLTTHVPSATGFTSTTPFSLRHLTGLSRERGIANQLSAMDTKYTPSQISAIRAAKSPNQITEQIWTIAREFKTSMAAEIASLPNDTIVGMLPYVSSYHDLFTSRIGHARSSTYEVSNVGSINNEDSNGRWKIDRVVFTQSGMGTGPAMSVNVASIVGGLFTISFTWLQGEIDDSLVEKITQDVEFALTSIGERKEISFH